jgi:hypothetical protein
VVITVDAYDIAYMALPKAACSSVKRALAQIDPDVEVPEKTGTMTWHKIYPTMRFRPHRWEAQAAGKWRFCVVRDPARRLMSCYTDIVLKRNAVKDSPRVRRNRDLPNAPDMSTFFRRIWDYEAHSSNIKHHTLPAWLFLGQRLHSNYDRIFRTTEMDDLGQDLSLRSGQPVQMPHANATQLEGDVPKPRIEDLDGAAIDTIREYLDREYDYLSAFYENPLGPRIHGACAIPERRVS